MARTHGRAPPPWRPTPLRLLLLALVAAALYALLMHSDAVNPANLVRATAATHSASASSAPTQTAAPAAVAAAATAVASSSVGGGGGGQARPSKSDKAIISGNGKLVDYYEESTKKMAFFSEGMYHVRNVAMAKVLNGLSPRRVFEFAGSGGFFAREAWRGAPPSLALYHHSDFTDVALRNVLSIAANESERDGKGPVYIASDFQMPALPSRLRVKHFDVEIDRVDVVEWFGTDAHRQLMDSFDVFATISFEHFEDDLGMLARLPRSSKFVFCVPNFNAPAHMRFFEDERSIRKRYDNDVVRVVDILTLGSKEFKEKTDKRKFIVTVLRL